MINGNEPINSIPDLNNHPSDWYGLTKREYFAAMAMQGMLSKESHAERLIDEADSNYALKKRIVCASVVMADALMKALNEGGKQ